MLRFRNHWAIPSSTAMRMLPSKLISKLVLKPQHIFVPLPVPSWSSIRSHDEHPARDTSPVAPRIAMSCITTARTILRKALPRPGLTAQDSRDIGHCEAEALDTITQRRLKILPATTRQSATSEQLFEPLSTKRTSYPPRQALHNQLSPRVLSMPSPARQTPQYPLLMSRLLKACFYVLTSAKWTVRGSVATNVYVRQDQPLMLDLKSEAAWTTSVAKEPWVIAVDPPSTGMTAPPT